MRSHIDPHRAVWRLLFSTLAGMLAAALLRHRAPAVAELSGWNLFCAVLLGLSWLPIFRSDAQATQRRAGSEDPGRTFVYFVVVFASAASLFAALVVSRRTRTLSPTDARAVVALCLACVALAWSLTHTAFALRYARLYYREDSEGVGGVDFPGGHHPTYFDFAYLAFTIGMTFQVSDTAISSRQIRRVVLFHAVVSFTYNTAIIAFVLNLIFGSVG